MRRGAAMVEMAAVAPVFVLLVMGTMDAARLFMVGHELTVAAREGCRVAAMNGKSSTDVTNRVNQVLTGFGLKTGDVTSTLSPAITTTTPGLGTPITLTLSVPFSKVSYLATPFLFKSTTITMSATMSSERF
jgi:Flp pilus assembly protein TadG